ncbi:hypothetical protein REC12_14875 [Desulfosporosinus sp. PR]|nr:hypothetical protein [Desulfosporosinus sp. PR]
MSQRLLPVVSWPIASILSLTRSRAGLSVSARCQERSMPGYSACKAVTVSKGAVPTLAASRSASK